ncbi:hypothetical protein EMIT040CA3_330004 [Bacillus pseudomycoides]
MHQNPQNRFRTPYIHNYFSIYSKNPMIKPMLGFKSFYTAKSTISGIEAIHMIKNRNLFYGTSLFKIRISLSINYLD